MERPGWAPGGIDVDRPSVARIYDYYLGGFHNFASDRALVDKMRRIMPDAPLIPRANRQFLTRAVRFCLRAGVRQFLDIGSGIPTAGNVHEVARRGDPQARVVYVDSDPVAVAHSQAILGADDRATVIKADLREPKRILQDPAVQRLIDFDQPVALLLVAVLHFIADEEDPGAIVDQLLDPLVPGSYLVLSHGSEDLAQPQLGDVVQMYQRAVSDVTMRSRADVAALFRDLELVPPGLAWAAQWRPAGADEGPEDLAGVYGAYAGVGRKR